MTRALSWDTGHLCSVWVQTLPLDLLCDLGQVIHTLGASVSPPATVRELTYRLFKGISDCDGHKLQVMSVAMEPACQGLYPSSAIDQLHDLKQVT